MGQCLNSTYPSSRLIYRRTKVSRLVIRGSLCTLPPLVDGPPPLGPWTFQKVQPWTCRGPSLPEVGVGGLDLVLFEKSNRPSLRGGGWTLDFSGSQIDPPSAWKPCKNHLQMFRFPKRAIFCPFSFLFFFLRIWRVSWTALGGGWTLDFSECPIDLARPPGRGGGCKVALVLYYILVSLN